jgi:Protein tyrosine and serine/threonine kinase
MGLSPDGAKQSLDDHDSGKLLRKHGLWDRSKIRKMFRKGDLDASSEFPSTRHVRMGLPRPATFKRQNSEKRERLPPVDWKSPERRALSSSRNSAFASRRSSPPTPCHTMLQSVPCDDLTKEAQLESELESKWILNLSMHFRDRSDREKFFVTYADQPNRWRRVTVSCDYRDAEPGSLEMDLKELRCQRDKSLLIYESIRDSLPDIQFYDTVTNLKLQSSDGRLHVHVTEDVNEIIPYPQRRTVSHVLENSDSPIPPMEVRECDLEFDSHLSGFAYKVRYGGKDYIKKEIPGPDTVDEFLYEVNALHDLHDTESVIRLEAIVVDDSRQLVKGLLISYAERGALVDLPYDHKGQIAWEDRVRWASQAVRGMSQIHEGYVQGDFTLSNIVMDGENDAKIIDINRRGRPVGWEDLDDPDIAAWNPAGIVLKESSEYSPARGSARRGRGQRKNKAYWNAQQENVDFVREAPLISIVWY